MLLPHLAIPPGLRHIVAVAMNPDPAKRYQNVEEFRAGRWIDELDTLLALPRRPHEVGGASRVADILLEQA